MPTIKNMNDIIKPELEQIFNKFFGDKYDQEARTVILEDLLEMIRNDFLDEINFCVFDSVKQQIIDGFSIKISLNQPQDFIKPKGYGLKDIQLTTTTDKFLIVKIREEITKDTKKVDSKLNELVNKWNFLNDPAIKFKKEIEQLLWVEDTKIELKEITNG